MRGGVLILDFDGTMTTRDVGDAVCDRFAPPAWREIDARWIRRELSLPEAQIQMWSLVRAERADLEAFAREAAVPRAGLHELLLTARDLGYRLVVASGGFDFCMRPLIETLPPFDGIHCNGAAFDGGRMTPLFNWEGLSCASCAVCKGRTCDRERAAGAPHVVFVGDGESDACAIGHADEIAAVRGGALEKACRTRAAAVTAIEDLREVVPLLRP